MTTETTDKKEPLSDWDNHVGAFAASIGAELTTVNEALKNVVGEPGDDALKLLRDPSAATDADIKEALVSLNIPKAKFNAALKQLRVSGLPVESTSNLTPQNGLVILPDIPTGESFLEMLRTGGVLKVDTTEVLSAVRVASAKRIGLYDLPKKLLDMMEQHAISLEEPCGTEFYELQKILTKNQYGEVLSVLGIEGSYVSETRKKEFFARLDSTLWDALASFNTQLSAWQKNWLEGAASPAAILLAITAQQTGGVNAIPPPDTSGLRAEAEAFVDKINKIFSGPGIPVARALAYNATRITNILDNDKLPGQIGASTKEEMLKKLGVGVGSDVIRAEQNVARYTLAIMKLKDVPVENELLYLGAMVQVGSSIPWQKLGTGSGSTL